MSARAAKRTLHLWVLALCFVAYARAQSDEAGTSGVDEEKVEYITLNPPLKVGDEAKLEITKAREIKREGAAKSAGSSTSSATVRVLEVDTNGAVLVFELGASKLDDKNAGRSVERLLEVVGGGSRLEVIFDETWQARSLRNGREVQAAWRKALDAMLEAPELRALSEKERRAAISLVEERISSEETLNVLALQEIGVYSFIWGWELPLGSPREVEDHFQNLLGGEPIPAKEVFRIAEYVPGVRARVSLDVTIDQEKAAVILRESTEALAKKFGKQVDDKSFQFSRKDHAEFDLDLRTGWLRHARWERHTLTAGSERRDVIEWRLVEGSEGIHE